MSLIGRIPVFSSSVLFIATLACPAAAHDPGLSSARLRLGAHAIEVEVALDDTDAAAVVAVDFDGDGLLDAGELARGRAALLDFASRSVVVTADGAPLTPASIDVVQAPNRDVVFRLRVPRPAAAAQIAYELRALASLPRGHRHYAALIGADGALCADGVLHARQSSFAAALGGAANDAPLARGAHFLVLGVEHVLIGWDHVLFLLTLLLAVRRLGSAAAIITSFTLAHSLTLALASLDLVRLPGALVEATIAASIVWVALENVLRAEPRHRFGVTFAFGLVHGFGFATVLRELGLGEVGGVAVPLVSFNLGVEVGQLSIAAFALPVLAVLRRRTSFSARTAPLLSCAAAAVGAFWLVERTLLAG